MHTSPTGSSGAGRNPKGILFCVYWLGHGGMEQHALHLARAFAERHHRVTLCYVERLDDGDWPDAEAFRTVKVGAPNPLRRYMSVATIARLAREAELVHCTGWDASAWGRLAAGIARRPVIVTEHSGPERSTQRSLGAASIGRAVVALHNRLLDPITDAVVAVARSQVDSLVREGVSASKIAVIPNGVALGSLRAAAQQGVTRAELGIPEQSPVVIQVGRFIAQKRQEWTYNAVKAARAQLGDVRLLLVGDGPMRPSLEQRAVTEDAHWARFLGHRPDVARLLALSDLAVLPSAAEALPMVMIEALALGIPQVATDVGDVGRVLGVSGAGVVVDPGDERAFSAACRAVLSDRASAAAMGVASRSAAEAFALERMIGGYEELFVRTLAGAYDRRGRRARRRRGASIR